MNFYKKQTNSIQQKLLTETFVTFQNLYLTTRIHLQLFNGTTDIIILAAAVELFFINCKMTQSEENLEL